MFDLVRTCSLSFDTKEPLANQQPQDLLVFHLWDDLTGPLLWLSCLAVWQKLVCTLMKPKRERSGHWGIQVRQTQKGTQHDPDHSWFLPLAMSVMGLYGLTVTMRIHQLLTIRKISNHLNHLLIMFVVCVRPWTTKKALIPRIRSYSSTKNMVFLFQQSKPRAFSIDQGNCQRGRAYGAPPVGWILCWWSQIITQSGSKWSSSDSQSGS